MNRYAVFYLPAGVDVLDFIDCQDEVYVVWAEDKEHAIEQWKDAEPDAQLVLVMVEA